MGVLGLASYPLGIVVNEGEDFTATYAKMQFHYQIYITLFCLEFFEVLDH